MSADAHAPTETNSSMRCFRECPRKYQLAYAMRLEPDGPEPEYFTVGTAWHVGMEHKDSPRRFPLLRAAAPSELWGEKLAVLAAAYDWRWSQEPIELIQTEFTFEVEFEGHTLRGQIDGIAKLPDERTGLVEYKTTGDSLTGSMLDKLRLDTQVGLYALAAGALDLFPGRVPEFILYDVTKKPTINPKKLTKADVARMTKQLDETDRCSYFAQEFGEMLPGGVADILAALEQGEECPRLYAARLNSDIGDRPDFYFARRNVHRTKKDFAELLRDVGGTLDMIDRCAAPKDDGAPFFPRFENSCHMMGTCQFFGLCENHYEPDPDQIPSGFRRREHRHPELDGKPAVSDS